MFVGGFHVHLLFIVPSRSSGRLDEVSFVLTLCCVMRLIDSAGDDDDSLTPSTTSLFT